MRKLPASPTNQQNFAICSLEGPCFYNLLVLSNKLVGVTTVQSDAIVDSAKVWEKTDLDPTNKRVGFSQYDIYILCENIHAQPKVQKTIFCANNSRSEE